MFIRLPLTKPIKVIFVKFAVSNPELMAADREAIMGIFMRAAFKTMSPVSRPLKARKSFGEAFDDFGYGAIVWGAAGGDYEACEAL